MPDPLRRPLFPCPPSARTRMWRVAFVLIEGHPGLRCAQPSDRLMLLHGEYYQWYDPHVRNTKCKTSRKVAPPARLWTLRSRFIITRALALFFVFAFVTSGAAKGQSQQAPSGGNGDRGAQEQGDIRFELLLSGRMIMKGADSVDFSNYKAGDGTLLHFELEDYHTASQAETRVQQLGAQASKVVERGPKLDERGETVGEREV